jgi:hypothetical protein
LAGSSNTTENENTFIGKSANGVAGITDATAVGANAFVTQSHSLVLGHISNNVGIGTTAPKSKLQVSGGDVYISFANKGIILKSLDGTCRRITLSNAGTLVVSAAITCP